MDEINIVYASDNNYACLAGVSMLSLFENNRHCDVLNTYILSDNISDINKAKLREIGHRYKREVHIVDTTSALENLKKTGVNGYDNACEKGFTAYVRLLIPDIIPEKKRVIYFDCDTLIIGDITELVQLDMGDKPIGLAYDCCQNRYKKVISLNEKAGYYNTGVMLLEIDRWKQRECMERILWHITNVKNNYPLVDQDFINVVLQGDIFLIGMKYNFLSQYFLYPYNGLKRVYDLQDEYFYKENECVNPNKAVILHFCGQTFLRPWYINSRHPAKKLYDHYYGLSPWKNELQKVCKWKTPYKIQYLLWKCFPQFINIQGGV